MTFVFTSYTSSPEYKEPEAWLKRIEGYTGILEELSKKHTVYSIEHIDYEGALKSNGVQYIFTRLQGKVIRFPFSLHSRIKTLDPDVVFINGFIFPWQVIQLRWMLGNKIRIVILHRAERRFTGLKRIFQKWADRYVDAYLFSSRDFANSWSRNINISKISEVVQAASVFKNGDIVRARSRTGVHAGPVFLWVGMLIPRKDPITVIKAFLQFSKQVPGAKLYMIYHKETQLDEIQKLLAANPLTAANVVLLGSLPHNQLEDWYNSADFFITASHYEGSGVALSEAMSCGCIPITSDFISFNTMTGDGKYGLQFKTGDEKDLLRALTQTAMMDIEQEKKRILEHYRSELSFEAIARKIEHVIDVMK